MTLAYVAAVLLAVAFAVRFARGVLRQRDQDRRAAERQAYEERRRDEQRERGNAAVAQLVERFYPFLKKAVEADAIGDGDPRDRLRELLFTMPGVVLGEASIGFPAVLPLVERRKHVLTLGKSGFGKTTIGLRLIQADLDEGRGICVAGTETELFRDHLLPRVPPKRAGEVVYFKPADPKCTLTWNPLALEEGDDRALAAGELFSIVKRALGEDSIGARADAILASALAVLVGRTGATLMSVGRLLEDEAYRAGVLAEVDDPYLRQFWTRTFPEYPAGAVLPISNRLNQFLRQPTLRAALCHPSSSFSIREALSHQHILFFDLGGLDPDASRLVAMMLLSKFQLELMRREKLPESERNPFFVHLDEFHTLASSTGAEGTWRELLSRGRRYGLGLHLFTQHPNQLTKTLQHEILGNVSSIVALNLSGADALVARRELLVPVAGGGVKPIPAEELVSAGVGEGYARLGSGACALWVKFAAPTVSPTAAAGERIRDVSWKTYAAPPVPFLPEPVSTTTTTSTANASTSGAPSATAPSRAGRGGSVHTELQNLAREWGEARGFRATIEEEILGGAGRVDVALIRDGLRLAVEVAISSKPAEVAAAITKDIAAGFTTVAIVAPDDGLRGRIETHIAEALGVADRARVRCVDAEGLRSLLDELAPDAGGADRAAGYRVVLARESAPAPRVAAGRATLARLVGAALLRRGGSS
jgi:hypothetical protein